MQNRTDSNSFRTRNYADIFRNIVYRFSRWFALVLLFVFLSIRGPGFLSVSNMLNILNHAAILFVLAVGETFSILSRGIDLSVGGVLTFSAVVTALAVKAGAPPVLGIITGLGVGTLSGLINGIAISRVGIPPFIATYAMLWISRGLAYIVLKGNIIFNFSPSLRFMGSGRVVGIPATVLVALAVIVTFGMILNNSKTGTAIRGIGANVESARLLGINVKRTLTTCLVFGGLLSGLTGLLVMGRLNAVDPTMGDMYTLEAISAVILGGTQAGEGGLVNTASGVLLLTLVMNGLNMVGVSIYWQQFVLGAILIAGIYGNQYIRKLSY